jgi:hypothetical protein
MRSGVLESVTLAQVCEQTVGRLFDHVEHALETLLATVIGVGHLALRAIRCVLQKQAELVLKSGRTDGLQVGKIRNAAAWDRASGGASTW